MRTTIVSGFAALVLASGCLTLSDTTARVEGGGDDEQGEFDRDDCKIEDGQVGTEGTILRLGARTVTFHDWVGKAGSAGEFVGFSITVEGASTMSYVVKSGGELHASSDASWLHPAGPGGGDMAPAISNVDFCEECTDEGCGDGDGGGECADPDGCPDGGGDGDGPIL